MRDLWIKDGTQDSGRVYWYTVIVSTFFMANRHLSRSIVLQSLFEWDLNAIDRKMVIEVLDRNI